MSFVIVEDQGVRRRVAVARNGKGVWVGWPGGAALIEPDRKQAHGAVADNEIVAPMTGKVVQVRVAAGQEVAAEDVLVVLEAMKMEYRLTAPRAGKVASIGCKEGELVDLGAMLVTLQD